MFDLLRDIDDWKPVRTALQSNWEQPGQIEALASLDWNIFKDRINTVEGEGFRSTPHKSYWIGRLTIAAGILLILGVAGWMWMQREMIIVYETGYGEVEEVVLNDESTVRLNANSTLYWDSNWKRRGSRNVRIQGEAFFNVAHKDGGRFFVSTPDLTVMVTGTSFNVTKRRDETRVFLESGEVFLQLNKEESEGKGEVQEDKSEMLKMVPGEQLSFSSKTDELVQMENLTVEEAASWKTGELIFKDIPLRDVLQELSDVYGKSFVVEDPSLFERKIDVGMPYKDWETVKSVMELMIKVEITESDNQVTIK